MVANITGGVPRCTQRGRFRTAPINTVIIQVTTLKTTCGVMHNQFKTQKFKHLMLAMGPRDLNAAPYSPVHCSSHSMTSVQSSELTELPVVENSQLFAQRAHSTRYAPKVCIARAPWQECPLHVVSHLPDNSINSALGAPAPTLRSWVEGAIPLHAPLPVVLSQQQPSRPRQPPLQPPSNRAKADGTAEGPAPPSPPSGPHRPGPQCRGAAEASGRPAAQRRSAGPRGGPAP